MIRPIILVSFGILFILCRPLVAQEHDNLHREFDSAVQRDAAAEASRIGNTIIETTVKEHGTNSQQVGIELNFIGLQLLKLGEAAQAQALLSRSLCLFEELEGQSGTNVGVACHNLADAYRISREFESAKEFYVRAIRIKKEKQGESVSLVYSLSKLAMVETALGHHQAAIDLSRQAYKLCRDLLGKTHSDTGFAAQVLAKAYQMSRANESAEELYSIAFAILAVELGISSSAAQGCLDDYTKFRAEMGMPSASEQVVNDLFTNAKKLYEKEDPTLTPAEEAVFNLMMTDQRAGDFVQATNRANALVTLTKINHGIGSDAFGMAVRLHSGFEWRTEQGKVLGLLELMDKDTEFLKAGDFQSSIQVLNEALTLLDRAKKRDTLLGADLLSRLGSSYYKFGRFADAISALDESVRISSSVLPEYHPDLADAVETLGIVLLEAGDTETGRKMVLRSLDLSKLAPSTDNKREAVRLNDLGVILLKQGQIESATKLLFKSIILQTSSNTLNSYAHALQASGSLDRAEQCLRLAIAIDETGLPKIHPDHTRNWNNLGSVLHAKGMPAEAIAAFDSAISQDIALGLGNHPNHAIHLNNKARVLAKQGKLNDAVLLWKSAIDIDKDTLGDDHQQTLIHINNMNQAISATE